MRLCPKVTRSKLRASRQLWPPNARRILSRSAIRLLIAGVNCEFEIEDLAGKEDAASTCITARVRVRCSGQTGVEMEALTGVSAALLTIYDMTKGVDDTLEILNVRLLEKRGGRSGVWTR